MSYKYKIHHLPTSDPVLLSFLAGKFASLRLSALTASPASFSATFERESTFTASQWISRLQRPQFHTFIAVAYSPTTKPEHQTIDTGNWIGCGTLIGATPKKVFEILESGGTEMGGDEVESKWHMTFVYNNPDHRGRGVAKMLIHAALDFTEQDQGVGKRSRTRIMIHPDNAVVKRLYESVGFLDAGNCTLAEAYTANGDEDLLPADVGASDPEKYHSRMGIIMERISSDHNSK